MGNESSESRARWSEMPGSAKERVEMRLELERVMRRSRVWRELWVGKVTCCVRQKVSSRVRNGTSEGGVGWSTWKLKSPVIRSSEGEGERASSKVEKSVMKAALEEEGGR
jgi:hypothetical protein